jgi:hypothetical protein
MGAPGASPLGTWDTTNLKARKRKMAPKQVVT